MINIIIGTVEGDESYTEVNFFKGIIDQEQSLNLISFGLAKARKERVKIKNKSKIMRICDKIDEQDEEITIFFIGDGEVTKDIPSMKETYKDAKAQIEENLEGCNLTFMELIIPDGKKFEQVIDFEFPTKAGTYFDGFKDFITAKDMWNKEKIDWEKLLAYFDQTDYKEIFRVIHSLI